ncbi:MAG: tetratricopeptide repeat protein [Luteimonas sp.]
MIPVQPPGGGDSTTGRYRFGDAVVDESAHTLLRAGVPRAIEPKTFAVLLALLQRPGELLGRDELLDRVWGHRHVTPGVLTRAIAQLRQALDDDSQNPRYIVTQHALGYRFIGVLEADAPATTEVADGGIDVVGGTQTLPVIAGNEERLHAVIDGTAVVDNERQRPFAGSRNGRIAMVLAAAMVIAFAAFALIDRQRQQLRPIAASIAILPFTTLSNDSNDRYFAEGLAVEMHDALAGVHGLKVAAQLSPNAGNRDIDVKALGNRLGVATVLDASVRRDGSRMRINARLSDCATGFTLWSHTYDRRTSDVFATQSEIANAVARSLVGAIPGLHETLVKRLTPTKNVAAFDSYLKGLQQLLRSDGGGSEHAITFFNQALASDGGFARAQVGVCRAELVQFENRDADFDVARTACLRAKHMDPSIGEVGLALGDLYRVSGDLDQAAGYYDKLLQDPTTRPDAYVGLAKVDAARGKQDSALHYLQRAIELRPGDAYLQAEIGFHQYIAGHVLEAIASYRKAIELSPDDASLWSTLGGLQLTAGNNAAAVKALQRSIAIAPSEAALSNLGTVKYQAGEYAAAAELHRRATTLNPDDFLIWGNLADALMADPATAPQARAAFLEAATRAERYVRIKSSDAKALAALGWYRVNLGETQQARDMIRRSEALADEPSEVALFNAETFVALGDLDQARQRVAAARAAGVAETRITTNAVLHRAKLDLAPPQPTALPAPSGRKGHLPGE